ncbi:MAG: PepSY domain-containing protein [Burkholderiales bacterium]|nr:PepSY domain-containing protein [Burkholderiales bacterium]
MILKRSFWVWLHRWAGLLMAGFLIIVGATGSLLAFYPELERLINPQFNPKQIQANKLDIATLAERAEQQVPHGRVDWVTLEGVHGAAQISMSARPDETGQASELGFNQMFLDPYTGEELGRRQSGEISEGMINFMPFVYKLHDTLALGKFGVWALGICALIWTIDCFVGFYLTLPQRRRQSPKSSPDQNSWGQRWWPAWKIRWRSSSYKLNFDLHRASGLWLWLILLTFAWSSVYMNLWDTVYTWTTRAVMEYKAPWTELPKRDIPLAEAEIGWRQAQRIGEKLMAEQAEKQNFAIEQVVALGLNRMNGTYAYTVRSSKDIQDKRGRTNVFFDANSSELKLALLPSGQYSGNTVTTWLAALHMANVFGLPYRIFVCVLGLVIVMLSVTGIIIWMKKRQARFSQKNQQQDTRYLGPSVHPHL